MKMESSTYAILTEVIEWFITLALSYICILLLIKVLLKFRLVFGVLDYLAMPGTIIHELGHYLGFKMHGIHIQEVKWFHWRYMLNRERARYETGGVAGFVRPVPHSSSVFVAFQVSAAPLATGALFWLVSVVGVHLLIAETSLLSHLVSPLYKTILVTLFLWIGLASAASMLPSDQDMRIVLDMPSRNLIDRLSKVLAWLIKGFNRLLHRQVEGVYAWGAIISVLTLVVLLRFSIPGGGQYLEPFSVIVTTIREVAADLSSVEQGAY